LDVFDHFLAVALICGVPAVELRAKLTSNTFDTRAVLSPATAGLYKAARAAALGPPDLCRPLHRNDLEEFIQPKSSIQPKSRP
jgi:phenylalanine ammonia-lyase